MLTLLLLQVAAYEAVHRVRNWADLKHRLGQDRRCYAFFHTAMPNQPLIVLHVALTQNISDSVDTIVKQRDVIGDSDVTTAIFYSITSTQKGLRGIDFGIHLIRKVANEIRTCNPQITKFSSLSPIPLFRKWLLSELKCDRCDLLTTREVEQLSSALNQSDVYLALVDLLERGDWMKSEHTELLQPIMTRLCGYYLSSVKHRSFAYDPVANFHLRNGATLWRVNWMADTSLNGMKQSFGIMVNYRYYLDEMETNCKQYIFDRKVALGDHVNLLLQSS